MLDIALQKFDAKFYILYKICQNRTIILYYGPPKVARHKWATTWTARSERHSSRPISMLRAQLTRRAQRLDLARLGTGRPQPKRYPGEAVPKDQRARLQERRCVRLRSRDVRGRVRGAHFLYLWTSALEAPSTKARGHTGNVQHSPKVIQHYFIPLLMTPKYLTSI
jgi:hypothetical protein